MQCVCVRVTAVCLCTYLLMLCMSVARVFVRLMPSQIHLHVYSVHTYSHYVFLLFIISVFVLTVVVFIITFVFFVCALVREWLTVCERLARVSSARVLPVLMHACMCVCVCV